MRSDYVFRPWQGSAVGKVAWIGAVVACVALWAGIIWLVKWIIFG